MATEDLADQGEDLAIQGIDTILAGFDASNESRASLQFASTLSQGAGAKLIVASVLEYDPVPVLPVAAYDRAFDAHVNAIFDSAHELLLDSDFEARGLAGHPAPELYDCAIGVHADLLVLGSTRRGPVGRFFPGPVPDQLLRRAPCPIAVVPPRYEGAAVNRIGVAFQGRDQSWHALEYGASLARAMGAQLELLTVLPALSVVGETLTTGETRDHYRELLEQACREVGEICESTTLLDYEAGPARTLATATDRLDLLVTGSRGPGAVGRILLGSTTISLFRTALCPVIAVPPGS